MSAYTYDDISARRLTYSDRTAVSATITRPDNTTAYDAADVIGTNPATNLTFSNVLMMAEGGVFKVHRVTIEGDFNAVPAGMTTFRLHLFNAAPTVIADGTAFALADADRTKYLGYITVEAPADLGGTIWAQTKGIDFVAKLAALSTTLYGMLETVGGFTPAALTVFKVTMLVSGV